MSKILSAVKKGIAETPCRILIYGAEKVGKSTFCAGSPSPIFIGAEAGAEYLGVERIQPVNWLHALECVSAIATDPHEYKTLVIDPLNWLEPMLWQNLCERESVRTIDDVGGGYGKGYNAAAVEWRQLLYRLEQCWNRGMNVILSAHCVVTNFKNPEGPAYDKYEIALHPKASGMFRQWVDSVLFARIETFADVDKKTKRAIGLSSGARLLCSSPSAAYDAGSRPRLPETFPLSWDDYRGALCVGAKEQAMKLATSLGEPFIEQTSKYLSGCDTQGKIAELINRLNIKLNERETSK